MEPHWAVENLQTIRTLMERSALYRRALAPIMLFAGTLGIIAAGIGLLFHLNSPVDFGTLWLGAAVIVILGAFFIARRQAIKDKEKLWSPPTRRVAQALLPPLTAGFLLSFLYLLWGASDEFPIQMPFLWALFYGCALHAAGFFTPRGIKLLGWVFIICSFAGLYSLSLVSYKVHLEFNPHLFMGFFFGALHLFYGAYLYLTEKGKNAA
ncbi:MAG TPA: hypothetical protein VIK53_17845 [Verrucomicrobiae bacterium]